MRLALNQQVDSPTEHQFTRWAALPGLCCQAAGGEAGWTDDLTLGWLLFYLAADLMDSVQDGDEPDAWWAERGPGVALAAASGLYFSGSLVLNEMYRRVETQDAAAEIINRFYSAFLVMTSGQHGELVNQRPTLEQYWQHAASKSGEFFGLACRAGARLATDNQPALQAYREYGINLGVLLQVMDDLDDIRLLGEAWQPKLASKIARSLPVIYAFEVGPPNVTEQLRVCLDRIAQAQMAAVELIGLLDDSGSARYVDIEIDRHRTYGLRAIELANPLPEFKEKLVDIIVEM